MIAVLFTSGIPFWHVAFPGKSSLENKAMSILISFLIFLFFYTHAYTFVKNTRSLVDGNQVKKNLVTAGKALNSEQKSCRAENTTRLKEANCNREFI